MWRGGNMPVRKTNETWLAEVHNLTGQEYSFLEPYKNSTTKIMVQHNICGCRYTVIPKAFLNGNRCPECNPARKLTTKEFKAKIAKLPEGNEYKLESEYIGHHNKIRLTHLICGTTYEVTASDFIKGRRCRKCVFNSKIKSQEEWEKQVKDLTGNDYIFLEPYVRDDVKIRYRHNTCGFEHTMTPNNFINGTRCVSCSESSGEANIRRFLTESGIEFESQKRFKELRAIKPLSYDFYLPSLNVLIEFQGEQHYRPIEFFGGESRYKLQKQYDTLKKNYADSKGMSLIEVSYKENTYPKVTSYLALAMAKLANNS